MGQSDFNLDQVSLISDLKRIKAFLYDLIVLSIVSSLLLLVIFVFLMATR